MKHFKLFDQISEKFWSVMVVFSVLVFSIALSACSQSYDDPLLQYAEQPTEEVLMTRASLAEDEETSSPSWSEGGFDSYLATFYTIKSPYQFTSNRYRFQVITTSLTANEVWIKYFSPQGNVVYQKMLRKGGLFEIERTFQQEGVYKYRIFVHDLKKPSLYSSVHRESLSLNVKLPLYIPPVDDDYLWKTASPYEIDKWNFYKRWCTSWVAYKVNQMWNTETTFNNRMFRSTLSNASNWKTRFIENGYKVDKYPKPGDIIWWGPQGRSGIGEMGHVGFVHEVRGRIIVYTDYNAKRDHTYRYHEENLNALGNVWFIHVQKQIH